MRKFPRRENTVVEALNERPFGLRVEIERISDAVGLEVADQRALEGRRVMTQIQGSAPRQEVRELLSLGVPHAGAARPNESVRGLPAIIPHLGFQVVEWARLVHRR